MSTDAELLEQMKLQNESPDDPRQRRVAKQKFAKSKFTVATLKAAVKGNKVWIKCVSELEPWANGEKLQLWEDYYVSLEDAITLDERRFAVILVTPIDKD